MPAIKRSTSSRAIRDLAASTGSRSPCPGMVSLAGVALETPGTLTTMRLPLAAPRRPSTRPNCRIHDTAAISGSPVHVAVGNHGTRGRCAQLEKHQCVLRFLGASAESSLSPPPVLAEMRPDRQYETASSYALFNAVGARTRASALISWLLARSLSTPASHFLICDSIIVKYSPFLLMLGLLCQAVGNALTQITTATRSSRISGAGPKAVPSPQFSAARVARQFPGRFAGGPVTSTVSIHKRSRVISMRDANQSIAPLLK